MLILSMLFGAFRPPKPENRIFPRYALDGHGYIFSRTVIIFHPQVCARSELGIDRANDGFVGILTKNILNKLALMELRPGLSSVRSVVPTGLDCEMVVPTHTPLRPDPDTKLSTLGYKGKAYW